MSTTYHGSAQWQEPDDQAVMDAIDRILSRTRKVTPRSAVDRGVAIAKALMRQGKEPTLLSLQAQGVSRTTAWRALSKLRKMA